MVSMPLTWDALRGAVPLEFRLPTVVPMLEDDADAWAGWLSRKQDVMHRLTRAAAPGIGKDSRSQGKAV